MFKYINFNKTAKWASLPLAQILSIFGDPYGKQIAAKLVRSDTKPSIILIYRQFTIYANGSQIISLAPSRNLAALQMPSLNFAVQSAKSIANKTIKTSNLTKERKSKWL